MHSHLPLLAVTVVLGCASPQPLTPATSDPPAPCSWRPAADPPESASSLVPVERESEAPDSTALYPRSTAFYDSDKDRWLVVDRIPWPVEVPPVVAWVGWAGPDSEVPVDEARLFEVQSRTGSTEQPDRIRAQTTHHYALGGFFMPVVEIGVDEEQLLLVVHDEPDARRVKLLRHGGTEELVLGTLDPHRGYILGAGECERSPDDEVACYQGKTQVWLGGVRVAPDGSSIVVQGYLGPDTHDHRGCFHWVFPTPDDPWLRRVLAERPSA